MACVPIQHLNECFAIVSNELPIELQPILSWFEEYYLGMLLPIILAFFIYSLPPIGRMMDNGMRKRARFPIETWNLVERVLKNEDRTDNYAGFAKFCVDILLIACNICRGSSSQSGR